LKSIGRWPGAGGECDW